MNDRYAEFKERIKLIVDKNDARQDVLEFADEIQDVLESVKVGIDAKSLEQMGDMFNDKLKELGKTPIVFKDISLDNNAVKEITKRFMNAIGDGIRSGAKMGVDDALAEIARLEKLKKPKIEKRDKLNNKLVGFESLQNVMRDKDGNHKNALAKKGDLIKQAKEVYSEFEEARDALSELKYSEDDAAIQEAQDRMYKAAENMFRMRQTIKNNVDAFKKDERLLYDTIKSIKGEAGDVEDEEIELFENFKFDKLKESIRDAFKAGDTTLKEYIKESSDVYKAELRGLQAELDDIDNKINEIKNNNPEIIQQETIKKTLKSLDEVEETYKRIKKNKDGAVNQPALKPLKSAIDYDAARSHKQTILNTYLTNYERSQDWEEQYQWIVKFVKHYKWLQDNNKLTKDLQSKYGGRFEEWSQIAENAEQSLRLLLDRAEGKMQPPQVVDNKENLVVEKASADATERQAQAHNDAADAAEREKKAAEETLKTEEKRQKLLLYRIGKTKFNPNRFRNQDMMGNIVEALQDGFGGFGDGLYAVTEDSILDIIKSDLKPEDEESYFSFDASKYNLYINKTVEQAEELKEFLTNLQKFILAAGDFRGFDDDIEGIDEASLFADASRIFGNIGMSQEQFAEWITSMKQLVVDNGLDKTGNFTKANESFQISRNFATRFMQKLGYQGVLNNTGDSDIDGMSDGTVIYEPDFDEITEYIKNTESSFKKVKDFLLYVTGSVESTNKTIAWINKQMAEGRTPLELIDVNVPVPSEEEIKSGSATWRGMPIQYDAKLTGEARNLTDFMKVGSKFFDMDQESQKSILDHEVAHTIADQIMYAMTDNWAEVADKFTVEKMLPEGARVSFYTEEDDNGNKWYREGLYGDVGATALQETITRAVTEYFSNPDALQHRSSDAFGYIEKYLNQSGDTLDNVADKKEELAVVAENQKKIESYEELKNVLQEYYDVTKRLESDNISTGSADYTESKKKVAQIEGMLKEQLERAGNIDKLRDFEFARRSVGYSGVDGFGFKNLVELLGFEVPQLESFEKLKKDIKASQTQLGVTDGTNAYGESTLEAIKEKQKLLHGYLQELIQIGEQEKKNGLLTEEEIDRKEELVRKIKDLEFGVRYKDGTSYSTFGIDSGDLQQNIGQLKEILSLNKQIAFGYYNTGTFGTRADTFNGEKIKDLIINANADIANYDIEALDKSIIGQLIRDYQTLHQTMIDCMMAGEEVPQSVIDKMRWFESLDATQLENIIPKLEELQGKIKPLQEKDGITSIFLGQDEKYYDEQINNLTQLLNLTEEYQSLNGPAEGGIFGFSLYNTTDRLRETISALEEAKKGAQNLQKLKSNFSDVDFSDSDFADISGQVSSGFISYDEAARKIEKLIEKKKELIKTASTNNEVTEIQAETDAIERKTEAIQQSVAAQQQYNDEFAKVREMVHGEQAQTTSSVVACKNEEIGVGVNMEELKRVLGEVRYNVKIVHDDNDKTANKIALDDSTLEATLTKVFANILNPVTEQNDGNNELLQVLNEISNKAGEHIAQEKTLQEISAKVEKIKSGGGQSTDINPHIVTDPYGKPVEMYRGIRDAYGGLVSNRYHGGTFFTDDIELAKEYAGALGKVEKVLLSMKNPLEIDGDGAQWSEILYLGDGIDEASKRLIDFKKKIERLKVYFDIFDFEDGETYVSEWTGELIESKEEFASHIQAMEQELDEMLRDDSNPYGYKNTNKWAEFAKSHGYDGVIFKNIFDSVTGDQQKPANVMVAFEQNQIHSIETIGQSFQTMFKSVLSEFGDINVSQYLDATKEDIIEWVKQLDDIRTALSGNPEFNKVLLDDGDMSKMFDEDWEIRRSQINHFKEKVFADKPELLDFYNNFAKTWRGLDIFDKEDYLSEDDPYKTERIGELYDDIKQNFQDRIKSIQKLFNTTATSVEEYEREHSDVAETPGEIDANDTELIKQIVSGVLEAIKANAASAVSAPADDGVLTTIKNAVESINKKIVQGTKVLRTSSNKKTEEKSTKLEIKNPKELGNVKAKKVDPRVNELRALYEKQGTLEVRKDETVAAIQLKQIEKDIIALKEQGVSLDEQEINNIKEKAKHNEGNRLIVEKAQKAEKQAEKDRVADLKATLKRSKEQNRVGAATSAWNTGNKALESLWKIDKKDLLETNDQGDTSIKIKEVNDLSKALTELNDVRQRINETLRKGKEVDPDDANELAKKTQQVTQYTEAVKQLVKNYDELSSDNDNVRETEITFDSTKDLETQLKNAVQSLEQGKVRIGDFNAATGRLKYTVQEGAHEFKEYEMAVRSAGNAIVSVQKGTKRTETFFEGVKRKFGELTRYFSASSLVFKGVNEIRKGIQYVKEIDAAMVELRKVTDETEESYDRFLDTASKTADKLGSTIAGVTEATATFVKLGYSMELASEMAEAAIIYKNVGDNIASAEDAADSIISTLKGFGLEASESMRIVDRFNEVGNNFAITSQGLGEALRLSASALSEGGNTLDESIGIITAANEVVNDPSSVGTALKTLTLRLRGSKTELEEMGEDVSDMVTTTSQLQAKLLALTGGKVDIMLDENTFKSTTQILREMADAWDTMTDIQRASALELMGGKRQANVLSALIQNFDTAEAAIEASANSAGSALRENEKYLDSIQGKIDQLTNALQTFWNNTLDSDWVKGIVDIITHLVKFADSIGGVNTALSALFVYLNKKYFKLDIFGAIKEAFGKNATKSIDDYKTKLKELNNTYQDAKRAMLANPTDETVKVATEASANIDKYKELLDKRVSLQKELDALVSNGNASNAKEYDPAIENYKKGIKDCDDQLKEFDDTVDETGKNGVKSFKTFGKGVKAAAVEIGKMLAQMALMWVITQIIGLVTKAIDLMIETPEEAAEKFNELVDSLNSAKNELEDIASQLDDINAEIDQIQSSGSLSFAEKEQLDLLKQQRAELEAQKGLKEALIETQQKAVNENAITQAEYVKNKGVKTGKTKGELSGEGALVGAGLGFAATTAFGAKLGTAIGSAIAPGIGTAIGAAAGTIVGVVVGTVAGALGGAGIGAAIGDIEESTGDRIDNMRAEYEELQKEYEEARKKYQDNASDKNKKKLDKAKEALTSYSSEMSEYFTELDGIYSQIDLSIYDPKKDKETIDALRKEINAFYYDQHKYAIQNGGQNAKSNALTYIFGENAPDYLKEVKKKIEEALETTDDINLRDAFDSDEEWNEFVQLLRSMGIYAYEAEQYFEDMGTAAKNAKDKMDFSDVVSDINKITDGVNSLKDAWDEINETGFVTYKTLASLKDTFGGLGDVWERYFNIMASGTASMSEMKDVTEELITEYLNKEIIDGRLTKETKLTYVVQLEALGITNSEEIVDNKLRQNMANEISALSDKETGEIDVDKAKEIADAYGYTGSLEELIKLLEARNQKQKEYNDLISDKNTKDDLTTEQSAISGDIELWEKLMSVTSFSESSLTSLLSGGKSGEQMWDEWWNQGYAIRRHAKKAGYTKEQFAELWDTVLSMYEGGSSLSALLERKAEIEEELSTLDIKYEKGEISQEEYNQLVAEYDAELDGIEDDLVATVTGTVNVELEITGIGSAGAAIDEYTSSMETLASIQSAVAESFSIPIEKAREFAAVYPEILKGAQVSADGQILLNSQVVKNLLEGERAVQDETIKSEIAKIDVQIEALKAKRDLAVAQLKLAEQVANGEITLDAQAMVARVNNSNALARMLIENGMDEASAYQIAMKAMSGDATTFNDIVGEVAMNMGANFDEAAKTAATTIGANLYNSSLSVNDFISHCHEAAKAVAGISTGTVLGDITDAKQFTGESYEVSGIKIDVAEFTGNGVDGLNLKEIDLTDFINNLTTEISGIDDELENLNGVKTLLNSYLNSSISSFGDNDSDSSNPGDDEQDAKDIFQDAMDYWENRIGANQSKYEQIQNEIDLLEKQGKKAGSSYYAEQMELEKERLEHLQDQKAEALTYMKTLTEGSDEWWEVANTLNDIEGEIDDVTMSLVDLQDAIGDVKWSGIEELGNRLDDVAGRLSTIRDLIAPNGEEDWFDEGNWTEKGTAVLGSYVQEYEYNKKGLEEVTKELDAFTSKVYNSDNADWFASNYGIHSEQEYYDYLQKLTDEQYKYATGVSDTKQEIADMYESSIDAVEEYTQTLVDNYNDYIDVVKEALDAERDLYNFKKDVEKQTKNLMALERRIASLSGSTNASDIAERRKLEAELAEQRESLNDTYYEHSMDSQQDALDKEAQAYEEAMNKFVDGLRESLKSSLSDMDKFMQGVTAAVTTNAPTILQVYKDLGLELDDALVNPWQEITDNITNFSTEGGLAIMNSWIAEGGDFSKFADGASEYLTSIWTSDNVDPGNEFYNAVGTVMDNILTKVKATVEASQEELSKMTSGIHTTDERYAPGDNGGGGQGNGGSGGGGVEYDPSDGNSMPSGDVKNLQTVLNTVFGKKLSIDGDYGPATTAAVKRAQKTIGVGQDGYYGPNTRTAMDNYIRYKWQANNGGSSAIGQGIQMMLGKLPYTYYAKGTLGTKQSGFAITDESWIGEEITLAAGKNGQLQYLKKGSAVMPADISANLVEWGKLNPDMLKIGGGANIGMINNAVIKPELSFEFDSLVHVDNCSQETLKDLEKMVDNKINQFNKQLNYSLKKFTR